MKLSKKEPRCECNTVHKNLDLTEDTCVCPCHQTTQDINYASAEEHKCCEHCQNSSHAPHSQGCPPQDCECLCSGCDEKKHCGNTKCGLKPSTQDWKGEFEKEFPIFKNRAFTEDTRDIIKDFISSLLAKQEKELTKEHKDKLIEFSLKAGETARKNYQKGHADGVEEQKQEMIEMLEGIMIKTKFSAQILGTMEYDAQNQDIGWNNALQEAVNKLKE